MMAATAEASAIQVATLGSFFSFFSLFSFFFSLFSFFSGRDSVSVLVMAFPPNETPRSWPTGQLKAGLASAFDVNLTARTLLSRLVLKEASSRTPTEQQ